MRAHRRLRMARWQRWLVDLSALVLLASGMAWLVLQYSVGPGAGGFPHPAQAWLMKLHGAATLAALFALGALASTHVPAGWRLSRAGLAPGQRGTGLLLLTLAALLVLSGYALWYWVGEDLRAMLGWLHAATGLLMGAAIIGHRRPGFGARIQRASSRSSASGS